MKFNCFGAVVSRGILGLAVALLLPAKALAAGECNGFINIAYPGFPNGPAFVIPPPANLDMEVSFGTGSITGGTGVIDGMMVPTNSLKITSFTLDLACNADFPLVPGCVADFPPTKILFVNIVSDTCGSTDFTAALDPMNSNQVVFTTTSPGGLVIPHDTPPLPAVPPACSVKFTLQVVAGFSNDAVSPGEIEEVVGYKVAKCDNGVLVSSGSQTSSIKVSSPTFDFNCYEIDRPVDFEVMSLIDMFGSSMQVPLKTARRLCAPAVKVTDGQAVPGGEHLVGYEINKGKIGSSTFQPVQGVHVNSQQFGALTVDVEKISGGKFGLLVPSNKSLDPNNPPPPDLNPKNHFLCYNIDVKQGTIPPDVVVLDQFGQQTITFKNKKDWRLCTPVNKNGGDPDQNPQLQTATGLLCYVAKTVGTSIVKGKAVSWANQVEPNGDSDKLDKLDNFCVSVAITKP